MPQAYRAVPDDDDNESISTTSSPKHLTLSVLPSPKTDTTCPELSPTSPTSPTTGRLIKLVGLPPEPAPKSENEDEATPPVPTITSTGVLDDDGRPIVDVLDSMNEEPFTLETFEKMIRLHARKGKDFIIARVTTVDPHGDQRFYHSYYAAHHINKVLFRTQPEEGLLHRMKARNPLNNMIIIGDVYYYCIKALSVNLANLSNRNVRKESLDSVASGLSVNSSSPLVPTDVKAAAGPSLSRGLGVEGDDSVELLRLVRPWKSSSSKHTGETGDPPVSPTGSFDDRLTSIFAARISSKINKLFEFLSGTSIRFDKQSRRRRTLHIIMRPDGLPETSPSKSSQIDADGVVVQKQRRRSADDAFADDHLVTSKVRIAGTDESRNSSGTSGSQNARNARDRLESLSLSGHRKIRSSSFMNDRESRTSGVEGRHYLNDLQAFEMWIQNHFGVDVSSPIIESPKAPIGVESLTGGLQKRGSLSKGKAVSPPVLDDSEKSKLFYVAEYYASDDDFLFKSAVRAYFRENAYEPSDAVLFSIPPASPVDEHIDGEQHPALPNFVYTLEEVDGDGWNLYKSKVLQLCLIGYIIFGILLVRFIVPKGFEFVS
ncbi:hypothetical protein HDU76_005474 [Blyttiomyces sp. JEL0837]|nr:hypothetical protein HDU76_005474 [Blyttiomyces sp. JEL0837]